MVTFQPKVRNKAQKPEEFMKVLTKYRLKINKN